MVKIALVTCPPEDANRLARALVSEKVAACVNLMPNVSSVYRWDGDIQEDAESLLIIKTSTDRIQALRAAVSRLHTYDTPEFLVVDTDSAQSSPDYISWVIENTRITT